MRILHNVKRYHIELKKHISDADQWLNKSNQLSKKTKYRVIQIFQFFSSICLEQVTESEEYDEEQDNEMNLSKK